MSDTTQTTDRPLISGVARDEKNDAVIVYCSRRPTDEEVRAIHDAARTA